MERALVRVHERFFVAAQTSPRAGLWVVLHRALTLPLSAWGSVHHVKAMVGGSEARITCVGRWKRFRDLLEGLFGQVERTGGSGRRLTLSPGGLGSLSADLVIVDVHPWFTGGFVRRRWPIVPEHVSWRGSLAALPPARPAEALRSEIRKLRKYEYWLEEASGPADWREFVDGMLRPHAKKRFGDRAVLPGRHALRKYQSRGSLLFVRRDELRVAGGSVVPTPNGLWLPLCAVRDGEQRWLREGALSSLYLLSFEWARENGYATFDAGRSIPFVNNGVARFKAKLGLAPSPVPLAFTAALRPDPASSGLAEWLRSRPAFQLRDGAVSPVSLDLPREGRDIGLLEESRRPMISQLVQDVRNLPSDLAVGWRTNGRSGLRAMLPIGRFFLHRRFLVIEQGLGDARDVAPPPGVEIERIGEECSSLRSILRSRQLALFERRLAAGRICLIARRNQQPVGYTWISERMEPEFEYLPLALPAEAAYLWDLFVVRDERGSGIGSALASARMDLARRLGYRLGWRTVSPRNKPSLRTAEKTGKVRIVGELRYVRILGRLHVREVLYGDQPVLAG